MHTDTPLGFALKLALLTSVLFLPANVLAQAEMTQPTEPAQQMSVEEVGMQRLDVIEVTATKQDLLSAGRAVLGKCAIRSRPPAPECRNAGRPVPHRAFPVHPEPGARPEPGIHPRRIRRRDPPRPAGGERAGRYLSRRDPLVPVAATPDLDLFDLDRIETLRGPQGTLFGSGSIGGTLRLITNQPKLSVTETKGEINTHVLGDGDIGGI